MYGEAYGANDVIGFLIHLPHPPPPDIPTPPPGIPFVSVLVRRLFLM